MTVTFDMLKMACEQERERERQQYLKNSCIVNSLVYIFSIIIWNNMVPFLNQGINQT